MKYILLVGCSLLVQIVFGQTSLSGRVVQKGTTDPVPYATIGLLKRNTGINASQNGEFSLPYKDNLQTDTLVISSVGYESVKIPVLDPTKAFWIELEKKFVKLEEVLVKENWKTTTLNEFENCGKSSLVSSGYQTQVAQRLDAPVASTYLSSVRLCTGIFIFNPGNYDYRLRVYDIDSLTGGPGNDLYNGVIEVRSNTRREKIDLSEYYIKIPGKQFFVAVEWIYIPGNRRGKNTEENNVYGPGVGIFKEDGESLVWMLSYNMHWQKMLFTNRTTISATVKY